MQRSAERGRVMPILRPKTYPLTIVDPIGRRLTVHIPRFGMYCDLVRKNPLTWVIA